jgi:hypothetical protein
MELFIQIRNGHPFEHPILGGNFREAFPLIDVNNLPPNFSRFERIAPPTLGVYEACETNYEWVEGVVKDVHRVRPMTTEEKTAKQQATKDEWAQGPNFSSWSFDEATCSYLSPVPYPDDGKFYRWDEPTVSWIEVVL